MSLDSRSSDGPGPDPARPAAALVFDIAGQRYAIRTERVHGVAECSPIRRVRRGPSGVLGLTQWRGCLLTVLDLPALLGHAAADGPQCLLRLAPPHDFAAFRVPATVRMALHDDPDRDGGGSLRWIDPATFLGRPDAG